MTETVTIRFEAEVGEAQQGMKGLRDDLKKTKDESKQAQSSLGNIGKNLGDISPQLGKVTRGVSKLSAEIKKLGVQTGNNGAFGRMSAGLGKIAGSSAFKKGVGIAGIALAGTALFSSILGNQQNKLAGFDKLNALGPMTVLDWLDGKFPKLRRFMEDAGGDLATLVDLVSALAVGLVGKELIKQKRDYGDDNEVEDVTKKAQVQGTATMNVLNEYWVKIIKEWQEKHDSVWRAMQAKGINSFEAIKSSADSLGLTIDQYLARMVETETEIQKINREITQSTSSYSSASSTPKTSSTSSSSSSTTVKPTTSQTTTQEPITTSEPTPVKIVSSEPTQEQKDYVRNLYDEMVARNSKNSTADNTSWLDKEYSDPVNTALNDLLGNGTINSGVSNATAISNSVEALSLLAGGGAGGTVSKLVSKVGSALGKAGDAIADVLGGLFKLPGFAEGGVFLPNQPQLAVLGDNKTEPEVAAPYSMIVTAVQEALRSAGSSGNIGTMRSESSDPVNITLELDGKTLARVLYDPLTNETRRRNGVGLL